MGRWSSIAGFEPIFAVDNMHIEVTPHVRNSVETKSLHNLRRTSPSAAIKKPQIILLSHPFSQDLLPLLERPSDSFSNFL